MTKQTEAMKLALEALERGETELRWKAITALREARAREAIEQPEQPQQKPLTDEKIEEIAAITLFPVDFARAIEAAHGIKGDA